MATAAQLEELFILLADSRTTNALAVAGLTLIVLEHVSNFAFEVEHVWKTRRSLANVFYIWIRYFTLISMSFSVHVMLTRQTSDDFCQKFLYIQLVACSIICVSTDLVLVARVWILYHKSRLLLFISLPLIAVEMASLIIIGFFTVHPLQEYVHAGQFLDGCYATNVPRLFTAFAIPILVVAVVMFLLTCYKCGTAVMILGPGRTPLITMFLRDGILWFFIVVMVCIGELTVWIRARQSLLELVIVPTTAGIACVGARVLMNIKSALAEGTGQGQSTISGLSTIDFFQRLPADPTVTIGSQPTRSPLRREHANHLGVESEPWYLKSSASTSGM